MTQNYYWPSISVETKDFSSQLAPDWRRAYSAQLPDTTRLVGPRTIHPWLDRPGLLGLGAMKRRRRYS